MREVHRDVIAHEAKALIWFEGQLYDVAAGWRSIPLDGSPGFSRYATYADQFDAAAASPSGDIFALVASSGTKGLLLGPEGKVIREINRSYYQAEAYRYPLALFTLPDGRTGLVHCPDEYNQLEIEVAETGEKLTADAGREPEDFFHSRLAVSPSGRYLLSAGWVWHPLDVLAVFDLHRALAEPATLDTFDLVFDPREPVRAEIAGACFVQDDIVASTSARPHTPHSARDLAPNTLARWSADTNAWAWRRQLDDTAGDLIPMAGNILALHNHPRLYDSADGELLAEWPDLATGRSDSAIVWDKMFSGPARVAVDSDNQRFAVTDGERVTVIQLG